MGKEGNDKRPWKKDIEFEYPKWPWVDYKLQDVKVFEEMKKLPIKGLDPKGDITNTQVSTTNNVQKFITTNPLLLKDHKN